MDFFTPLHRHLGKAAGPLTPDLIREAAEKNVPESADLDFKQKPHFPANFSQLEKGEQKQIKISRGDEVAKDVAAMANSGGGWIIYGIEEQAGPTSGAAVITPVDWNADADEKLIREAIYTRTHPPVTGIEFHQVDIDNGQVVFVHVPNSTQAPHLVTRNDTPETFSVPWRDGPHTRRMNERAIESAYRARYQKRQDFQTRLDDLRDDIESAVDFGQHPSDHYPSDVNPRLLAGALAVAAPYQAGLARRLTQEEAISTLARARGSIIHPHAQDETFLPGRLGTMRRSYRSWRAYGSLDMRTGDGTGSLSALHEDGSTAIGVQLGRAMNPDNKGDAGIPTEHIFYFAAAFISLSITHARATNNLVPYGARIQYAGPAPLTISTRLYPDHSFLHERQHGTIHRLIPVDFEIDPQADKKTLCELAMDVALDLASQGGAMNLGLPSSERSH